MVDLFLHLPIDGDVERKPAVPSAGFDPVIATVKRLRITPCRTATGIGLDLFYLLFDNSTTIVSLLCLFSSVMSLLLPWARLIGAN